MVLVHKTNRTLQTRMFVRDLEELKRAGAPQYFRQKIKQKGQ
jgi:hypothetical protein